MMIYNVTEIIFPVVSGQIQYTLGPSGSVGSNFTGSISGKILTVTGINSGAITLNQTITGPGVLPGTTIYLNGVAGTPHANTAALQLASTFQIGSDGNTAQHLFGFKRNVKIWKKALTDAQLIALTK